MISDGGSSANGAAAPPAEENECAHANNAFSTAVSAAIGNHSLLFWVRTKPAIEHSRRGFDPDTAW